MEIFNLISEDEIISILMDLVSIKGHKETGDRESKVAQYILELLQNEGIEATLDLIEMNRPNVYGFLRGNSSEIELMFNGHIDTIPGFGMEYDAFKPFIKENKVYGRGSVDMKAGITAQLAALIAIKRSGIKPSKTIMFAGVIGEEERSKGTERLIKEGINSKYVIVGEPTELNVSIAHKGMEWIEVAFKGTSTHGSRPKEGINAIYAAADFCRLVNIELQAAIDKRKDELVGTGTINVGVIKGGNDPNIVPDLCRVEVDRRWLPGETLEFIHKEIEEVAKAVADSFNTSYNIRPMRELTASMINAPYSLSADDLLVQNAILAVNRVTGKNIKPVAFQGWSDAGLLGNHTNAKCIVLGPGNLDQAHSANEFCDIDQILKASEIYLNIAKKLCI